MNPIPSQSVGDPGTEAPKASGPRPFSVWGLRDRELDVSGPVVMGILNLTPDSFSDGGELSSVALALGRARRMVEEGAGILDVGGESTRPGAAPVSVEAELERVLPLIEEAAGALSVPVSVDTRNAAVARAALRAGARIVNDVSGLRHDPEMAGVVAEEGAALVVSHMRGTPATMKERARYHDVVGEVVAELREGVEAALEAGVAPERIVVDPGIGFAKTGPQSLALLRGLDHLLALGRPVLVGPSRKSFIGEITGQPVGERSAGTLAACVLAYARGARIFRVHEVGPAIQALAVTRAILEAY